MDDDQFKHNCIVDQKSIGTFFPSSLLTNSGVSFSVDNIISRLISDELNLEATALTPTLSLSLRQTSSIIFYEFIWRCMRKAQLLPKKDVMVIFPKLTRERRSGDTINLGRIKMGLFYQD